MVLGLISNGNEVWDTFVIFLEVIMYQNKINNCMNNKYKQSILHNEIEDFLLGKGKYFVMDRDRGEHDSTDTYSEILEYYLLEGENYELTEKNIIKILKTKKDISGEDLLQLLGILWSYFVHSFKGDKKLKKEWKISKELKDLFIKNIETLNFNNIETYNNIKWIIINLKRKYNFDMSLSNDEFI